MASFDHQYSKQVTKIVQIPLTYNNDSSKDDSRPEVDGQVIAGEWEDKLGNSWREKDKIYYSALFLVDNEEA